MAYKNDVDAHDIICDVCVARATKTITSANCKDCAEWFIGHYCSKCEAEVRHALAIRAADNLEQRSHVGMIRDE